MAERFAFFAKQSPVRVLLPADLLGLPAESLVAGLANSEEFVLRLQLGWLGSVVDLDGTTPCA